jgi:hypothetical protein
MTYLVYSIAYHHSETSSLATTTANIIPPNDQIPSPYHAYRKYNRSNQEPHSLPEAQDVRYTTKIVPVVTF